MTAARNKTQPDFWRGVFTLAVMIAVAGFVVSTIGSLIGLWN